jgi:diguanylate cyclase (GGDEF)-like protein/PAS domain S-box-containing protein
VARRRDVQFGYDSRCNEQGRRGLGAQFLGAVRAYPMKSATDKQRLELQMLIVFLGAAALMAAYEFTKELIFTGSLTPWESHAMTILVAAAFATVAAFFVRQRSVGADEALRESEEKLRGLYQLSPLGIAMTDMDGRYVESNESLQRLLGYRADQLPAHNLWGQAPQESAADLARQRELLARTGRYGPYEKKHVRQDGSLVPLRCYGMQVTARDGRQYLWSLVEDITESRQREDKLRLAASVFASSYEGILITDANNLAVDANPAFSRITGYAREEIIGQSPRLLASGQQGAEFYAKLWASLQENDFWRGEIWNRRKNGEVYAETLAISTVRDDAGQLQNYIGVFSDISQLKAHALELHHLAHYDTLTGLPNRRLLADRLSQGIARARRSGKTLAVCYLDLDGFKPINDRYGHAGGDHLLTTITTRLKGVLRADDTLARLGGDEFVILLSDLDQADDCYIVLQRGLAAVSTPVLIGETEISISASIGVTLFPADDVDADTLLRHADQGMYRAKEAGKNRYHVFDPERDRQLQSRRDYRQCLREALDNDEFVLHYQPKVDLVSGEVVGAEALIRWQHPERGLLLPGEFLHYLDGSELEIALGEWVIDAVLRQIAAWQAAGLTLTVSANVSAHHLLHKAFAERLRLLLASHADVAPDRLELEILETAALGEMDRAVAVVTACRQLGVNFALDDFGTGYSSLTYFRSLPVQTLKIDRSFVRDMLENPGDLGIVESLVLLAKTFNRSVIAEGVETLAHGALLVQLGCRLAQGYGIAHPMPAAQLPGWVGEWHEQAAHLALDDHLPHVMT